MSFPRLIFGTASLANNYGISNPKDETDKQRTAKLIATAQEIGISNFDTAPVYGDAELLLGKYLKKEATLQVDSKISIADCNSFKSILNSIQLSLDKIQVDHLGVLYLHEEDALFQSNNPNLISDLQELKELGYFRKLGTSIYSIDQLEKISLSFPQIEVFQVPENICDRRLRNSKLIQDLAAAGTEFVVRSIFLQGLLLMKPVEIHSRMSSAIPAIESLNKFASQENRSLTDLCLAYAMNLNWSSGVIISAYNAQQLRQINTSNYLLPSNWEKEVKIVADDCIDPRNWST
jgi:aryl-alcohol dehydrogenase-like predicted oxidoreductase